MIGEKYSDVKIEYSEVRNKWLAEDDDKEIRIERNSLAELKKAIDHDLRAKQEGRFKRFTAIKKGRGWSLGLYEIVTVTSILEHSNYGSDCWISYKKSQDEQRAQREKASLSKLYKDTPTNRDLILKINHLQGDVKAIERRIIIEEDKLVKITVLEEGKS